MHLGYRLIAALGICSLTFAAHWAFKLVLPEFVAIALTLLIDILVYAIFWSIWNGREKAE